MMAVGESKSFGILRIEDALVSGLKVQSLVSFAKCSIDFLVLFWL